MKSTDHYCVAMAQGVKVYGVSGKPSQEAVSDMNLKLGDHKTNYVSETVRLRKENMRLKKERDALREIMKTELEYIYDEEDYQCSTAPDDAWIDEKLQALAGGE